MRKLYADFSYLMCVIAILLQCASCFGTSFGGEDNYIDSTVQMKSITERITNDVGKLACINFFDRLIILLGNIDKRGLSMS